MNPTTDETLNRLCLCFPNGYVNYNQELIADRRANRQYGGACCRLRDCETDADIICAVIESLSYDCCKSRPYKTPDANVDFRRYMIAGMNAFLGTSFSESDFLTVHTHIGSAINRPLTAAFVRSGYDLTILKKHKRERMISADLLLETINGLEYKAKSLEQMRGGNDVLRRLIPKLINQQASIRIVSVIRCEKCEYWIRHKDDNYGTCSKYICTKHETGYCDCGKEKEVDS